MNDRQITDDAVKFARRNKKRIAKGKTDLKKFPNDEFPISVFMAGSPGAGKTESANNLISLFQKSGDILHIDADDLRSEFSSYNGSNSSLFQYPTSILADKMQDIALKQEQSYVFDGTLAKLDISKKNIHRNLTKNRLVYILYVYQNPVQAWKFVKARKERDGRLISKDVFIDKYFKARENVNLLKKEYGNKIQVDIVVKNIDGTNFKYYENINVIDNYIQEKYPKEELEKLIT